MTPVQVRMARAALELSPEQLSRETGLSIDALTAIEHGGQDSVASAKLKTAFEGAGVSFLDADGVRFDGRGGAARTVPLEEMNASNDE